MSTFCYNIALMIFIVALTHVLALLSQCSSRLTLTQLTRGAVIPDYQRLFAKKFDAMEKQWEQLQDTDIQAFEELKSRTLDRIVRTQDKLERNQIKTKTNNGWQSLNKKLNH